MTSPEDALERARAEVAALRAQGAYGGDTSRSDPEQQQVVTDAKLIEWAVIEPDVSFVRSTRRFGAPVTALKRGLVRLLTQYHADVHAQQTRFNVNVLARLRRLEERLAQLEHGDKPSDGPSDGPP